MEYKKNLMTITDIATEIARVIDAGWQGEASKEEVREALEYFIENKREVLFDEDGKAKKTLGNIIRAKRMRFLNDILEVKSYKIEEITIPVTIKEVILKEIANKDDELQQFVQRDIVRAIEMLSPVLQEQYDSDIRSCLMTYDPFKRVFEYKVELAMYGEGSKFNIKKQIADYIFQTVAGLRTFNYVVQQDIFAMPMLAYIPSARDELDDSLCIELERLSHFYANMDKLENLGWEGDYISREDIREHIEELRRDGEVFHGVAESYWARSWFLSDYKESRDSCLDFDREEVYYDEDGEECEYDERDWGEWEAYIRIYPLSERATVCLCNPRTNASCDVEDADYDNILDCALEDKLFVKRDKK